MHQVALIAGRCCIPERARPLLRAAIYAYGAPAAGQPLFAPPGRNWVSAQRLAHMIGRGAALTAPPKGALERRPHDSDAGGARFPGRSHVQWRASLTAEISKTMASAGMSTRLGMVPRSSPPSSAPVTDPATMIVVKPTLWRSTWKLWSRL